MIGGLSGDRMLLGLAIGIIVLIFLVLKTKVQAFLALIISTIIVGVVGGMPLTNITLDDGKTFGIINSITTGFGGTLGSIGIIIGFGVMMGQIFEVSIPSSVTPGLWYFPPSQKRFPKQRKNLSSGWVLHWQLVW